MQPVPVELLDSSALGWGGYNYCGVGMQETVGNPVARKPALSPGIGAVRFVGEGALGLGSVDGFEKNRAASFQRAVAEPPFVLARSFIFQRPLRWFTFFR